MSLGLFLPSSPDPSQHVVHFAASTTQVTHIADVLSAVAAVNAHALMIISDSGITFYAEHNHVTNFQVTIDHALFSVFSFTSLGVQSIDDTPDMKLGIDAQLLADSFAAVTTGLPKTKATEPVDSVVCMIKYEGEGNPLVVEFEDRLISERIEFSTFYSDYDYPYDDDTASELLLNRQYVQCEIILQSGLLSNLLLDLYMLGTGVLFLCVSNGTSHKSNREVHFISKGAIGFSKLIYPNSNSLLEKIELSTQANGVMVPARTKQTTCLNFSTFNQVSKAVKISTKCKILKDIFGVLSVQLLCRNPAVANYPGTLITFNIKEMSPTVDEFGLTENADIHDIFDDSNYNYVKEYDAKPVSYSDFREAEIPLFL